jgi:predicted Fe-S protein YdhL (DUF1289 family)
VTDDDIVEEWEERSAVMEYCGGLTRSEAEEEAWNLMSEKYGKEKSESAKVKYHENQEIVLRGGK